MLERLQQGLGVADEQIYAVHGLLDLADLAQLVALDRPELKYEPWLGATPARLAHAKQPRDLFAEIRRGDLLVHHPYDSFATSFEAFVQAAAADPDVIAIKTTVYRTSDDSPLVPALIECAEDGKQSVCLVELKARFDEHRNIEWSRALEQAGVHVVYGFPDLKIHAKMTLVVRREGDGLRRYVHVGTGNYHALTARVVRGLRPLHRRPGDRRRRRRALQLPDRLRQAGAVPQAPRRAVRAAHAADRADPGRRRGCRGRDERAHPDQGERAHRPGGDRGALRGLAAGRADRHRRALDLLAAPGRSRPEREHPRAHDRSAASSSTAASTASRSAARPSTSSGSADLMPRNLDQRVEVARPGRAEPRAPGALRASSTAPGRTTPRPGSSHPTARGRDTSAGKDERAHAHQQTCSDERARGRAGSAARAAAAGELRVRPGRSPE